MFPKHVARIFWRNIPGENFQPMTLHSRQVTDQSTFIPFDIPRAMLRPLTQDEKDFVATLSVTPTRVIIVWQDALDSVEAPAPKSGDVWTDGNGVSWAIVSGGVQSGIYDQQHDCYVQRMTGTQATVTAQLLGG